MSPKEVNRIANSDFLKFTEDIRVVSGKTQYLTVRNAGEVEIGEIRWWSRWRRYCFFPNAETVWDAKCLLAIHAVLDALMAERKRMGTP